MARCFITNLRHLCIRPLYPPFGRWGARRPNTPADPLDDSVFVTASTTPLQVRTFEGTRMHFVDASRNRRSMVDPANSLRWAGSPPIGVRSSSPISRSRPSRHPSGSGSNVRRSSPGSARTGSVTFQHANRRANYRTTRMSPEADNESETRPPQPCQRTMPPGTGTFTSTVPNQGHNAHRARGRSMHSSTTEVSALAR
jgi:hypothetical protein